jgi:hypothetical protein
MASEGMKKLRSVLTIVASAMSMPAMRPSPLQITAAVRISAA